MGPFARILSVDKFSAICIGSAVANFFTPASQKAKDRTIWSERSPDQDTPPTLLVAKYVPEDDESGTTDATVKRHKIAAFDLVRVTAGTRVVAVAHPETGLDPHHNRVGQATCRRPGRLEVVAPLRPRAATETIQ
jgi:hypothetical protein